MWLTLSHGQFKRPLSRPIPHTLIEQAFSKAGLALAAKLFSLIRWLPCPVVDFLKQTEALLPPLKNGGTLDMYLGTIILCLPRAFGDVAVLNWR